MLSSLLFDQIATIAREWDFLLPHSSQPALLLLSENPLGTWSCIFLSTKAARNHQRFASNPGGILRGEKDSGRRNILCLPNAAKWGLRF